MTRLFLRLSGIPVLVRGRENIPPGPVVLAPNHTSYLDALVLVAILGPRHVLLHRQARVPRQLGDAHSCSTGFGAVFVERFDVQKAAGHADELAEAAKPASRSPSSPRARCCAGPGCCRSAPARSRSRRRPASRWCRWRCAACARCCATAPGTRAATRSRSPSARRSRPTATTGTPRCKLRDRVRAEVLKYCGEADASGLGRRRFRRSAAAPRAARHRGTGRCAAGLRCAGAVPGGARGRRRAPQRARRRLHPIPLPARRGRGDAASRSPGARAGSGLRAPRSADRIRARAPRC